MPQVFVRNWAEQQIVQYDELALEDHSNIATRGERDRNEKSWVLKLNREGAQGPVNPRPDFVGNTPIHPAQRSRHRRSHQFEGLEEYNYQIDAHTGWRTYPSKSRGNLSRNPTHSSSSNQWDQHDDWKSNKSWNSWRSSSWTEQ